MVKLVDTKDLKSLPFWECSSSLAEGTIIIYKTNYMQSLLIKFKSFLKSCIFFIVAFVTITLDNDLNLKKTLNHFFYYKKCKKLFKNELKNNISKFQEYNFNSVLGSDGFLFVRTDNSQNVAKSIFDKIKNNKDYYYDKDGQFKFSCPSQTFQN